MVKSTLIIAAKRKMNAIEMEFTLNWTPLGTWSEIEANQKNIDGWTEEIGKELSEDVSQRSKTHICIQKRKFLFGLLIMQ